MWLFCMDVETGASQSSQIIDLLHRAVVMILDSRKEAYRDQQEEDICFWKGYGSEGRLDREV